MDNGDGTAYCYNIGHPNSPLYDEDSAMHSADVDAARKCADEIFGWGISYFYHDEKGGKHVKQLGNGWTVYRFTYIPRPDLGMR